MGKNLLQNTPRVSFPHIYGLFIQVTWLNGYKQAMITSQEMAVFNSLYES